MAWQITGQYVETCNCDYLCPCPLTALARTTHGFCTFAMGFAVERGQFDGTPLDGRQFVVVGHTPQEMSAGNWKVGVIVDEGATPEQRDALVAIASGQAGGPMANLAPMFGEFLGVESAPVRVGGDGRNWSVSAGKYVDEAMEGALSLGGQQMYLDNSGHPVNNRLGLGTAKRSHIHVFGLDWDQEDGRNNGHFAPFDWSG